MTLEAVRAEALAESATVTWRAHRWTIAPPDEWTTRFLHFIDREKLTLALEAALGSRQYMEFIDATPPPTLSDTAALINQIGSAFGIDVGEA